MTHNTQALLYTTLVNKFSDEETYLFYYSHFLPLLIKDQGYKDLFKTKGKSQHDLMNYMDDFIDKRLPSRPQRFFKPAPQASFPPDTSLFCVIL